MTTQQTKWGPEIPVNGKRPEWLRETDEVRCLTSVWHSSSLLPSRIDWPIIRRIKLRADHPHYTEAEFAANDDLTYQQTIDLLLMAAEAGQSVTIGHKQARTAGYAMKLAQEDEVPCNSKAPTPSPELTARMVAHLLDCGEAFGIRPTQSEAKRRYDEMKAIVAELRAELEPVDQEIERVAELMCEADGYRWDQTPEGVAKYESDGMFRDDYRKYARFARRALSEAGK